jgi:hypothetical protein
VRKPGLHAPTVDLVVLGRSFEARRWPSVYPVIASERHQNVVLAIPRRRNWEFEADVGINDSVSEALSGGIMFIIS